MSTAGDILGRGNLSFRKNNQKKKSKFIQYLTILCPKIQITIQGTFY